MEEGETEEECVIREVQEETSMKYAPDQIILNKTYQDLDIEVVVFSGTASGKTVLSHEHIAMGWFTIDEITAMDVMPYIKESVDHESR